MKQLIIPDKVQKEMLTDFMIMGETRGLIGGYCEDEFPVCYANEGMARMLGSGRLIKEKLYRQRMGNWLLSVPAMI